MITKMLCRLFVLLLVVVGSGLAQANIPDTPAGHTLQAWLDAFNSGDRAKIQTYVNTVDRSQSVDGMISFRNQVTLIASYLFDRPTHLIDIYNRKEDSTTQNWTLSYLPGARLTKQPVFVLTSKRTFSGAEEFAFDLKNKKRATIVGETTGGGAHPVSGHTVADYFMVGVPFAKSLDPVTKTNWEGTGVEPDVKVPAADALATAERLAIEKIQTKKDSK